MNDKGERESYVVLFDVRSAGGGILLLESEDGGAMVFDSEESAQDAMDDHMLGIFGIVIPLPEPDHE